MLALIVMDGGGLEPGPAVDASFVCLLRPVAQEGDGEDGEGGLLTSESWVLSIELQTCGC